MRYHALSIAFLLLFGALANPVQGQRTQFRGSQAYFGAGIGLFTYHGRIDLTQERSSTNFTRSSDPAAVLMGSFPIVRNRFFFRGMIGLTNLNRLGEKSVASNNDFLGRELIWFEPQVVYTPLPGSESYFLPYVYTGFGSLIADPFGGSGGQLNQPGSGVPGPERSVFSIPFGLGMDYAISPRLSVFFDVSYRFNFNYAIRNDGGRNPHDTSLIMAGVRFNFNRLRRMVSEIPPVNLPPALEIPPYDPPLAPPEVPPGECVLAEMNTLFFMGDDAVLTDDMKALLMENVEALAYNPACCAEVVGYTNGANTMEDALRTAQERARLVFDFYRGEAVQEDQLAIRVNGTALPCLRKEDPECSVNRRVETVMISCSAFPGANR